MVSWPDLGSRVTVRYRRPAGSVPPLTDVIGHLLEITPVVRVRTKTGAEVNVDPGDVVALRTLSDQPVRASQIRALEYADAMSWPGTERLWLDGWLLRAAHGSTDQANSAVPLDPSASLAAIPAVIEWYSNRGLTPLLAVPDRLLRLGVPGEHSNRVLVRDVYTGEFDPALPLAATPRGVQPVPEAELTAVDGELMFGTQSDTAVRASVTDAPDGVRWVGLSAVGAATPELCEALLAWGASRGATRGYIRVRDDDRVAADLAGSLGFVLHHHARYVTATTINT